jgi:hypothetical protein
MQTLNDQEEEHLLSIVKQAIDKTEDNSDPSGVLEKLARDNKLGPGKIRTIAYAYNTGRQTSQWDKQGSVLDKLAGFPLMDAEAVIGRIFGEAKTAETVDPDYASPPTWIVHSAPKPLEKVASVAAAVEPQDRAFLLGRAWGKIDREKRAIAEQRTSASALHDRVCQGVAELVGYFRKFARDRQPFALVEKVASTYFGQDAAKLLNLVYDRARLAEKKAGAEVPVLKTGFKAAEMPYCLIAGCLKAAHDYAALDTQIKAAEIKLAAVEEESLRPFGLCPQRAGPQSKQAGLLGTPAVGAFVGSMLSKSVGSAPKSKEELIEDAWLELEDPQHANELRKINANAILTSLMTDPDDPISAHDPESVMQAYNEIAQVTPRIAENSATLRPVLRRRLEGHTEPFEAKELTDIEKGLAAAKNPTLNTNLLSRGTDKLLG